MTITHTFDPPLPTDSTSAFNTKAFALVAGLNAWSAQANQTAQEVDQSAAAAAGSAGQSAASAVQSAGSANQAAASVVSAADQVALAESAAAASVAASTATRWVSGTSYLQDRVVISPIDLGSYRRITAGAGTTDPSLDSVNWAKLVGNPTLRRVARTANTALAKSDIGAFIDIASGTFTQTFAACTALGNGWWCYLSNTGTGDITLDPNGAETIDGLTSFVMYPGEVRLVQCDGVALRTVVINSFYKVFATSGSWIKPPGYTTIEARIWAGGPSGAAAVSSSNMASGSGGAACVPLTEIPARLPASVVVTVGAGGAAVSTTSTAQGVSGGNSQFIVTAHSGGPGVAGPTSTGLSGGGGGGLWSSGAPASSSLSTGGTGGNPRPDVSSDGSNMGFGGANSKVGFAGSDAVYGGAAGGGIRSNGVGGGGRSLYGGGGGGGVYSTFLGSAGTSDLGGNAGSSSITGTASPGQTPGGAGGSAWATSGTATSGAGARGEVRVWGVI
jgi:hypothetical protein